MDIPQATRLGIFEALNEIKAMTAKPRAKAAPKTDTYTVQAVGVGRRCRAGLCFGQTPDTVELTAEQAKAISADEFLRITAGADAK